MEVNFRLQHLTEHLVAFSEGLEDSYGPLIHTFSWSLFSNLRNKQFLVAFAKILKSNYCLSVCLSINIEQLDLHWTDSHEI